jgi:hypothetical protein
MDEKITVVNEEGGFEDLTIEEVVRKAFHNTQSTKFWITDYNQIYMQKFGELRKKLEALAGLNMILFVLLIIAVIIF